jgi:hypothetical protein
MFGNNDIESLLRQVPQHFNDVNFLTYKLIPAVNKPITASLMKVIFNQTSPECYTIPWIASL